MEQSKSEHNDIELSRMPAESLLLKASRLARWVGSEEIKYWIDLEMKGYNDSPISLKYVELTGRWINKEAQTGFFGPLALQEAKIESERIKLRNLTTPDTSGDWAFRVMQMHENQLLTITNTIANLSGIKSKVLAHLHSFVSNVYYEKEFDNLSESIFEKYKSEVDTLISSNCGDVLEQIPSVMSRLAEGDKASISQALTTVRRIIDTFADSIYPPSEKTINMGDKDVALGADKHQNRINAFVYERVESKARQKKIGQNLTNLYARVCTGIHNDVSADEAKSLFLSTYLLLGEVLHIGQRGKAKSL